MTQQRPHGAGHPRGCSPALAASLLFLVLAAVVPLGGHCSPAPTTDALPQALSGDAGSLQDVSQAASLAAHLNGPLSVNMHKSSHGTARLSVQSATTTDASHVAGGARRKAYSTYMAPGVTPFAVKSLTYVMDMCGSQVDTTVAEVNAAWHNSASGGGQTMQGNYESCSYGKWSFTDANNLVLGRVQIPCSGTYQGGAWSSTGCGTNEIYGWGQVALDYATAQGINIADYNHHILLLPSTISCAWGGLSSQTCGGGYPCFSWINQQPGGINLDTVMHEMGHSFGLHHSGQYQSPTSATYLPYGDNSSPMGSDDGTKCYNAPQAWSLSWSSPVATLSSSNLPSGSWQSFTLPALTTSDVNFLAVRPDWASGPAPPVCGSSYSCGTAEVSFYISYRTPVGYDNGLPPMYQNAVLINSYNGSQALTNKPLTLMLAGLKLSGTSSWVESAWAKVVIAFTAQSQTGTAYASATVAVCRFQYSPAECALSALTGGLVTSGAAPAPSPPPPPPQGNSVARTSPSPSPPPPPPSSPPPPPPPPTVQHSTTAANGHTCNYNGVCNWPSENRISCAADCVPCNRDGACQPNWNENHVTCPSDCAAPATTTARSPSPPPPPPRNIIVVSSPSPPPPPPRTVVTRTSPSPPPPPPRATTARTSPSPPPPPPKATTTSAPYSTSIFACNHDGVCEAPESHQFCPSDCALRSPLCVVNGICEVAEGETASNCPADCNLGHRRMLRF